MVSDACCPMAGQLVSGACVLFTCQAFNSVHGGVHQDTIVLYIAKTHMFVPLIYQRVSSNVHCTNYNRKWPDNTSEQWMPEVYHPVLEIGTNWDSKC
jgi:hypothetical protein